MDKQEARNILEKEVLPEANNQIPKTAHMKYDVVDESDPIASKLGLKDSQILYIAPIDTDTGELVEEPSLLKDIGLTGGVEDFQNHMLSAFRSVADSRSDAKNVFNIVSGHTYAKVRINPLLGGNI